MRYTILLLLIALLGSTKNVNESTIPESETSLFESASMLVCGQAVNLGKSFDFESYPEVFPTSNDGFYGVCEDREALSVRINGESTIVLAEQSSFLVNESGIVYGLEAITIVGAGRTPSFDIQKVTYDFEQLLGNPTSIRPTEWKDDDSLINIASIRMSDDFTAHVILVELLLD